MKSKLRLFICLLLFFLVGLFPEPIKGEQFALERENINEILGESSYVDSEIKKMLRDSFIFLPKAKKSEMKIEWVQSPYITILATKGDLSKKEISRIREGKSLRVKLLLNLDEKPIFALIPGALLFFKDNNPITLMSDEYYFDAALINNEAALPVSKGKWMPAFVCSEKLGYLNTKKLVKTTPKGVPIFEFKKTMELPAGNWRIFSGDENMFFLLDKIEKHLNGDKKKPYHIMYAVYPNGEKLKTLALEDINSIAGDSKKMYLASDERIVRVNIPSKTVHSKEIVTVKDKNEIPKHIAYSKEAGLFYASETAVIYVGKKGKMPIMMTPNAQIILRNDSLYV